MISIGNGASVSAFVDRMSVLLARFFEAILCAPFVDPSAAKPLEYLADRAHREHCAVTLVTTPDAAKILTRALSGSTRLRSSRISIEPNVHAKVYSAIARQQHEPRATISQFSNRITQRPI